MLNVVFFRPRHVSGCLALIKSLCVLLHISQDVGFVCKVHRKAIMTRQRGKGVPEGKCRK